MISCDLAFLAVSRGKGKAVTVMAEERDCLDTARALARMMPGSIFISLATRGGYWHFGRAARFRVSPKARKRHGKRWARELETQINASRGLR